jgi:hypothetical protein
LRTSLSNYIRCPYVVEYDGTNLTFHFRDLTIQLHNARLVASLRDVDTFFRYIDEKRPGATLGINFTGGRWGNYTLLDDNIGKIRLVTRSSGDITMYLSNFSSITDPTLYPILSQGSFMVKDIPMCEEFVDIIDILLDNAYSHYKKLYIPKHKTS